MGVGLASSRIVGKKVRRSRRSLFSMTRFYNFARYHLLVTDISDLSRTSLLLVKTLLLHTDEVDRYCYIVLCGYLYLVHVPSN